jgi:hypothetical protein
MHLSRSLQGVADNHARVSTPNAVYAETVVHLDAARVVDKLG